VDTEAVIRSSTTWKTVPMVDNIRLLTAAGQSGVVDLWERLGQDVSPFWAAAWTSGKALGRYLLDHPHIVSGREVLDVGSGSGIVAIASMKAGARKVVACDIDPAAMIAIRMNAQANGVAVTTRNIDCFAAPPGGPEVVLAADVFYESELATRAHRWLSEAARCGAYVLAADPGRGLLRTDSASQLARLEVPVHDELPDGAKDTVTIYRIMNDTSAGSLAAGS
jgi:predicted nicotinamide N-methyase